MRRLVAILALVVLVRPAAAENARALARREKAVRARLGELAKKEGDILGALESLRTQEETEQAAFQAAKKKVADTQKALSFVRADQKRTKAELHARLVALEPRLVARYKLGSSGYLPLLLSAHGIDDLLRRRRLLARVIDADLRQMAEVKRLQGMLAAQAKQLEDGERQLVTLKASAAARLAAAQAARADREAALSAIRDEKGLRQRTLAALEAARRRLSGLVRSLPHEASAGSGFAGLKGRLPFPAAGAIEVGFGKRRDPRYDTVIVHKGVDIRAPRGAKVRAVAAGRVVHAGWLRGYGNLVILDHGSGWYSLMAHLAQMNVKTGDRVTAGQTVGLVGDTGSLKGAYLYFEIRDGDRAVDPAPWFAHH